MKQPQRIILYTTVLTFGLIWIYFSRLSGEVAAADRNIAPHVGFRAPEISINTLTGEEILLSDFKGQPVIINFWATWCPPCRSEMPALQHTYDDYKNKGVVFLSVNALEQDSRSAVDDFVTDLGLNFPIFVDEKGIAAEAFQVASLPTTFFIDENGIIREIVIGGPMAEALLRTRIDNLLREPQ